MTGITRWWVLSSCALAVTACDKRDATTDGAPQAVLMEVPASEFVLDAGSFLGSEWALWRVGAIADTLCVTNAVRSLSIEARGTRCEGSWPLMEVTWNGTRLGRVRVASADWVWYRLPHRIDPGQGVLRIALLNDRFSRRGDLNLFVRSVALSGEDG